MAINTSHHRRRGRSTCPPCFLAWPPCRSSASTPPCSCPRRFRTPTRLCRSLPHSRAVSIFRWRKGCCLNHICACWFLLLWRWPEWHPGRWEEVPCWVLMISISRRNGRKQILRQLCWWFSKHWCLCVCTPSLSGNISAADLQQLCHNELFLRQERQNNFWLFEGRRYKRGKFHASLSVSTFLHWVRREMMIHQINY